MIAIPFKHIKMVQHNIGNGITEPKLAMADDNTLVVVKTYNGPEGPLVLFNEYFCYRLAILLDIPMPISGICLIDQNTLVYNDCITSNQYGHGFYSTYLNKSVTLLDTIIPLVNNKEIFYRILLFDHIIFNTDRNPGNLLVQYYKSNVTLQVIDHSHVFINQAIWDATCLKNAIAEKDYFSTSVIDNNKILYGIFFRNMSIREENFSDIKTNFRSKITDKILHSIISDIPQEWLPPVRNINALVEYVLYRVEHIDEICATILSYLNK